MPLIKPSNRKELIIVEINVDDLNLGSRSLEALAWLKKEFMKEFNRKNLRKVIKIIRWEINREKDIFKIDQKRYIQEFLKS